MAGRKCGMNCQNIRDFAQGLFFLWCGVPFLFGLLLKAEERFSRFENWESQGRGDTVNEWEKFFSFRVLDRQNRFDNYLAEAGMEN